MAFINVGLGNVVNSDRVLAMLSPESAPVKRLVAESKEKGMLLDATYGRKTRAVLVLDSSHVMLSPLLPETVSQRLLKDDSDA